MTSEPVPAVVGTAITGRATSPSRASFRMHRGIDGKAPAAAQAAALAQSMRTASADGHHDVMPLGRSRAARASTQSTVGSGVTSQNTGTPGSTSCTCRKHGRPGRLPSVTKSGRLPCWPTICGSCPTVPSPNVTAVGSLKVQATAAPCLSVELIVSVSIDPRPRPPHRWRRHSAPKWTR